MRPTSNRPLTILHTAGHPADAFDMAGGTLCHHARRGDRVTVLVFTHGARSHSVTSIENERYRGKKVNIEYAVGEKQQEVVEACALLEIEDVRFLGHEDDLLMPSRDHILAVANFIRELKPDVVITHSPFEVTGSAHWACSQITRQAIAAAGGLLDDGLNPHRVGEIFYVWMHGNSHLEDFAHPRFPQVIVDITDVADRKLAAIRKIQSQYYGGNFALKMLEQGNGVHGLHLCVPYGETFLRDLPLVCDHLPLSEHNLRYAREPLARTYQSMSRMLEQDE